MLGEDTTGLNDKQAAYKAVNAVAELNQDLGVPLSLKELGVGHDEISKIAEETMKIQRLLAVNPRTMNRENAVKLFERMWHGFS